MNAAVAQLRQLVEGSKHLTVLSGAGVSAASGVPTFRGADGLWRNFRPEQLATASAFHRDPRLVWEWYDWRRGLIAGGLHERAGTANVLRYHGSIWHLRCSAACGRPDWEDRRTPLPELPARCPSCGGLARPGVVWFGEPIDPAVADAAERACACDVFLSIGTSSVVYPAAALIDRARRAGATIVEVNPEATPSTSDANLVIRMRAEEALIFGW